MGGKSLARAVERKCAIRSLLDGYDIDAHMHSRGPDKVQKLRGVVFQWMGQRRTSLLSISTRELLESGQSLRGGNDKRQGEANLSLR